MRVFVTGATGFTGSHTLPQLIDLGYDVRCLVREDSKRNSLDQLPIDWVRGDLNDPNSLRTGMENCDALVNIASLGFGHAGNIVTSATKAGIQRCIFISTTAIFTNLNAKSKQVRLEAEELIKKSGLVFTILRPTMIYGSPRDRNIWRLIQFIKKSPLIPVLGSGSFLQQPVFVDDVAMAICSALNHETTIQKCYNIAGQQALTYNEMIDTVALLLKKRIRKIHFPSKVVVDILRLLEKTPIPFPIKSEQVLRLNENKNFDYGEAFRDFQYQPISFSKGIELELSYLTINHE